MAVGSGFPEKGYANCEIYLRDGAKNHGMAGLSQQVAVKPSYLHLSVALRTEFAGTASMLSYMSWKLASVSSLIQQRKVYTGRETGVSSK